MRGLHRLLERHAADSNGLRRIQAAIKLAESDEAVVLPSEHLDADPFLLTAANGTVDLRTGDRHPHRRTDLSTHLAGAEYDPAARSTVFGEFVKETTDGDEDLAACIQRIAGYTLTGDTGSSPA